MPTIKFYFGCTVTEIGSFQPRVAFTIQKRDGSTEHIGTDVLLAADGVKSITRSALLAQIYYVSEVEDTSHAAYRIMLPRERCNTIQK